jgi:hypothetical protein
MITEEKKVQERKDICKTCEHFQISYIVIPSLATPICKQCGCYMEAKWRLDNAECPMKKW